MVEVVDDTDEATYDEVVFYDVNEPRIYPSYILCTRPYVEI
jgi:hypothetical protein